MNAKTRWVRYFVDDVARVERFDSHGAATERARLLTLEGRSFVAIYGVDPRLQPDARPIASRFG